MDQFADLAKELKSAGVAHEMINYSGAQHSFTVLTENVIKRQRTKSPGSAFWNSLPIG
jgi:acetyl esterase/lipase